MSYEIIFECECGFNVGVPGEYNNYRRKVELRNHVPLANLFGCKKCQKQLKEMSKEKKGFIFSF